MKRATVLIAAILGFLASGTGARADFTLFEIQSGNGTTTMPFNNGINDSFAKSIYPGIPDFTVLNPISADPDNGIIGGSDGPLRIGAGAIHPNAPTASLYQAFNLNQSDQSSALNANDTVTLSFNSPTTAISLTRFELSFRAVNGATSLAVELSTNGGTSYQSIGTLTNVNPATQSTTMNVDISGLSNTFNVSSGIIRITGWRGAGSDNVGIEFANGLAANSIGGAGNATLRITAVPEPSTMAMLAVVGSVVTGAGVYRRRRAKSLLTSDENKG